MFNNGKYSAQNTYDEWNTTQVKLKLNNKTDSDILRWLQSQKYSQGTSMQGAIKRLVREEIARGQSSTGKMNNGSDI